MEARYETLLVIYSIVKDDAAPQTYLCSPHEIILRQPYDWSTIQTHLDQLAKEELIVLKQLDKLAISITPPGITKSKNLLNNFVASNFSFSNEKATVKHNKIEG